eukprot:4818939-Alexandrium_andersonii.AAC.1
MRFPHFPAPARGAAASPDPSLLPRGGHPPRDTRRSGPLQERAHARITAGRTVAAATAAMAM